MIWSNILKFGTGSNPFKLWADPSFTNRKYSCTTVLDTVSVDSQSTFSTDWFECERNTALVLFHTPSVQHQPGGWSPTSFVCPSSVFQKRIFHLLCNKNKWVYPTEICKLEFTLLILHKSDLFQQVQLQSGQLVSRAFLMFWLADGK